MQLYLYLIDTIQELSKNDDIESKSNTRDYIKPMKATESNKTGKRNNSDASIVKDQQIQ